MTYAHITDGIAACPWSAFGRLLPDTTGSERPETDVEQQRKLSAANRCIGVFMMARMAGLSQIYRPIQGRIHVSKSL